MTTSDAIKPKVSFGGKPEPTAEDAAVEPKRPQRAPVQFGPTKSAPGSRLKGGK